MDTNLFKVPNLGWAIKSDKDDEVQTFKTIEDAAVYLESIGIPDEEIDNALVDMAATGGTRANFGVLNGKFIFSDNARMNELLGVA